MQDLDKRSFQERHDDGLQAMREIIGAERTDSLMAGADDFNRPLTELLKTYVFNDIWNRPGLPRETRSLIVVALLCALNRPNELKVHVKAALTNGVTPSQIQEALLQATVYAGVPAGVEGFRLAREVLRENSVLP